MSKGTGSVDQLTFGDALWIVLREIRKLILPDNGDLNDDCHNRTRDSAPTIVDFMQKINKGQLTMLIVSCALTLLCTVVALFECCYVYRKISSEQRRNKLYFLITLFPISMLFCLVGMFSPRAAPLATSGGMLYFLLCLFVLVSLIRHLARGRRQLSRELLVSGKKINFQSPPFCCVIPFLPEARPIIRNLRLLEFIVLQAPIVRAFVLFIEATITIEIQRDATFEVQLCEFTTLVSILLAVFGVHTLYRLVSDRLSHFGFMWMFRIVDVALLFFSAQHPIIFQNILLRFQIIHCNEALTASENARFLCNFLIICELFFLALLGLITMNPKRNRLFDLYKSSTDTFENEDADDEQDERDSLTDSPHRSDGSVILFNNP